MPSIDEVFQEMESRETVQKPINDVLEIDIETREIYIPDSENLFGVQYDAKAERKYFKCPRKVGNNIDLANLEIYIVYQNAGGTTTGFRDRYHVTDKKADSDYITFSWELSEKVTLYKGLVSFIVCGVSTNSDGTLNNRWNTTIAQGGCLTGLDAEMSQWEQSSATDMYNQLLEELKNNAQTYKASAISDIQKVGQNQVTNVTNAGTSQINSIANKGEEVKASIPETYTDLDTSVKALNEQIIGKAPAIVESITSQSGKSVTVNDSADMPLQGMKLYGKSTQVTTTGKNLIAYPFYIQAQYFEGNSEYTNDGIHYIMSNCHLIAKGTSTVGTNFDFVQSALPEGHYKVVTSGKIIGMNLLVYNMDKKVLKDASDFTVSGDETEDIHDIYFNIGYSGSSVDIDVDIMLMNYDNEVGTFEPYTGGKPSPSPEYPQEIENIGSRWNGKEKKLVKLNYGTEDYYSLNTEEQIKQKIGAGDGWKLQSLVGLNVGDIAIGKFLASDTQKTWYITLEIVTVGTDGITGYIKNVSENLEDSCIKIVGKNLLNFNLLKNATVNNGTISNITDKSFVLSATGNDCYTLSYNEIKFLIKVKSKTKYTFLFRENSGAGDIYIFEFKDNKKIEYFNYMNFGNTGSEAHVLETSKETEYIAIRVGVAISGNSIRYEDLMLVEGEHNVKKSDYVYESYKESKATIPLPNGLPGIPVESDGNYTDETGQQYICDEIDFERGKYIQRVWTGTFDGSEEWITYNRENYTEFHTTEVLPETKTGAVGFCNQLIVITDILTAEQYSNILYIGANSKIIYCINTDLFDTSLSDKGLSNWKAHLVSNPMIIMTYLDNPIETDLTESQLQAYKSLQTFKPNSIISNDAGAYMDIDYAADTKTWITNKINSVVETLKGE